ncbi:hypothetical protein Tco_0879851, partial [Tanacetum coccineum]
VNFPLLSDGVEVMLGGGSDWRAGGVGLVLWGWGEGHGRYGEIWSGRVGVLEGLVGREGGGGSRWVTGMAGEGDWSGMYWGGGVGGVIGHQASGSSGGADFKLEVPDKSKAKSSNTNEGTCVKPKVPYVSNVDSSESDNELYGDSDDDNESDDNDNEGNKNNDDSGNGTHDSERTDSNEEENPNLNLNVDEEEEIQEEEYVHTTDYSIPTDEETDDENMEFDDEEYDDLYKDVNVRSKVSKHEEVGKGDVEMTDATHESGSQEKSYEQVVEDAHVTLTTSQMTKGSKQSSFVSSDFTSKFLILDNVPPVFDEVTSMMNVKVRQEESSTQAPPLLSEPVTAIPKTSTVPTTFIPPTIQHQ